MHLGWRPAGELLTGAAADTVQREMPTSQPVSFIPVPSLSSGSQAPRPSVRPGTQEDIHSKSTGAGVLRMQI